MKARSLTTCFAALIFSGPLWASDFEGGARDAWITGKVETVFILNRHLNGFAIDTTVEDGIVRLNGSVESDIDRDLAGQLAENVEGVVDVTNDLFVGHDSAGSDQDKMQRRSFGAFVDDSTTTAAVKARLVGNRNTSGLEIDVDTRGDIVTLSGRVSNDQEKQLAAEIARGTGDVADVRNNLVVDPE